jgi:uncharacterized protein (TIGR00288 family)
VPANPADAPNAALLIDFDNVTMGMRSDLSKELTTLLNSDIIKGKVTVQRAYADWRRYPQYIVPLSENSVDLIFAPAYGSSKKNATDIRMAIDGMELIFIRPEIGTYILLTGDSDFSSLVLKLKEYGKYVIGVGIQESSSDILVQNCDEYYSYTSLTGLRKTTEAGEKAMDPWILVEKAVQRMASRNDVMRSDRLKQVMMELDQSFDEGNFGFSKFSRFLSEAASRNLVRLRKLENGQYEVRPSGGEGGDGARTRAPAGRRSEDRDRRSRKSGGPPAREERRAGKAPAREEREEKPSRKAPAAEEAREGDPLQAAYDLLRTALDALTSEETETVRDSDLKRKMLEMDSSFDEGELGFGKFSRFLRQAHDHEIIDLEKGPEGMYHVSVRGAGEKKEEEVPPRAEAEEAEEPRPAPDVPEKEEAPEPRTPSSPVGLRLRRGEKARRKKEVEGPPPLLEGQIVSSDGEERESRDTGEETGATVSEAKAGASREAPGTSRDRGAPSSDAIDPAALNLPTDEKAIVRYLSNSYKGVGQKTAEKLVEAFGKDLYDVLRNHPEKLSSVIPSNRAEQLLEGWEVDLQRRLQRVYEEEKKGSSGDGRGGQGGRESGQQGDRESARKSDKTSDRSSSKASGHPAGSGAKSRGSTRRTRKSGKNRGRR